MTDKYQSFIFLLPEFANPFLRGPLYFELIMQRLPFDHETDTWLSPQSSSFQV